MNLTAVAGLLANALIADSTLAPFIRFAAMATRAAIANGGVVPDQYAQTLEQMEAEGETEELNAIMEAQIREGAA